MANLIGIDIGGTKIDGVLVNGEGKILKELRLPTDAQQGQAAVIKRIVEVIQFLNANETVAGIGIGCPGYVDNQAGVVREVVNLGWRELPLRDLLLAELSNTPMIALGNDVNAAALGEWYFGNKPHSLVYVAVGTGVGGAAVVNNHLVEGANSFAMEIGHWVLHPHGRQCKCGLYGCAEAYLSGTGLLGALDDYAPNYPDSPLQNNRTTDAIVQAARQHDPLAEQIMSEAADALGRVMATSASFYNPEQIVIGGGLGLAAADLWLEQAQAILQESLLAPAREKLEIKMASVPRIALGAACLTL